jgi:CubicO group peptidase (beta-lactamase class C family)
VTTEPPSDARSGTIDHAALDELLARARLDVDEGRIPACQVAIGFRGELVAFEALGDATTDTRFIVFSCTKAVTAGAVWRAIGDGLLDPSDPVAKHVPEFATFDKDQITLEQVLTHTGGFPTAPLGIEAWTDRALRLEKYGRWRTTWAPGSRFEYHPTAAHWVAVDVLCAVTGHDDHRTMLRELVLDPLGLDRFRVGLVEDDLGPFATLRATGDWMTEAEIESITGIAGLDMSELGGVAETALLGLNERIAQDGGLPGGGGLGTAADLAMLYQGFLTNPDQLWDPAVLANGIGHVRSTLPDQMWGSPSNRTLGLVTKSSEAGDSPYIGGKASSGATFGHSGAGGQIAWADPVSGLSVGYVTNALERNLIAERKRVAALVNRMANVAPS